MASVAAGAVAAARIAASTEGRRSPNPVMVPVYCNAAAGMVTGAPPLPSGSTVIEKVAPLAGTAPGGTTPTVPVGSGRKGGVGTAAGVRVARSS